MTTYHSRVLRGTPFQIAMQIGWAVVLAGLLWWGMRHMHPLITLDFTPLVAAAGLLLWVMSERLALEDDGVRLYLGKRSLTMFFVPSRRLRRVDVIHHSRSLPTAVLHYTSRLGLPFTLGVHSRRYAEGNAVTDEVTLKAEQMGVPVRKWYSPDWVAWGGLALLAAGLAAIKYQLWLSVSRMEAYAQMDASPAALTALPALLELTALYALAIACIGTGFGLLSAFHRADARFFLLLLWVFGSHYVPDPLIHWLVYIAINAILTAQMAPVTHVIAPVPTPPLWQWEIGLTVVWLGPAIAAASYFLGVALGRRRRR